MKIKGKLPKIKKNIAAFLSEEEGKINKKDIAKLGMGILALGVGLAGLMEPDSAEACWDLPGGGHNRGGWC